MTGVFTKASGRIRGVVKWYNARKGFGFITTRGIDCFVVNACQTLYEGQTVEFTLTKDVVWDTATQITMVDETT